MYEIDISSIFFNFLLPALIPISLFIIAEVFTWRRRDERQKAIRNQAYKHAFLVFLSLFLLLVQLDTYLDVVWNKDDSRFGFAEATIIAVIAAVSVLIIEQILRGSFFSSDSTSGYIILMLFAVPFAVFATIATEAEATALSFDPYTYLIIDWVVLAAAYLIIVMATLKEILYLIQKRREE